VKVEKENIMKLTYFDALALSEVPVPSHLEAEASVPILVEPQAQGDLFIEPCDGLGAVFAVLEPPCHHDDLCDRLQFEPIPPEGVTLVRGDTSENSHVLHAGFDSPSVRYVDHVSIGPHTAWWQRIKGVTGQILAVVVVPSGQWAVVIHTDEHGANGIGEGTYLVRRKRELSMWREDAWVED